MNKWNPKIGQTTSQLRKFLCSEQGLPSNAVETAIFEAHDILSSCLDPTHTAQHGRTGLVCGHVQSGKTLSMTVVSAMARDNGVRALVFIAGTTKNLVDQTGKRLTRDLRNGTSRWGWLMLHNPDREQYRTQLQSLVREWSMAGGAEAQQRTLLVTVMKHWTYLKALTELFSPSLSFPALVFDDEADQASLNTRPGAEEGPSSTYQRIDELRQTLTHHTYLQYTATPQAPLLISKIDMLSADFAQIISPGEGYTGGEAFFSRNNRQRVVVIPSDEICEKPEDLTTAPPPSLVEAMQFYMVGVALGEMTHASGHRSMLIHPSQRTAVHDAYYHWCVALKERWAKTLLSEDKKAKNRLLGEFEIAYDSLHSNMQRGFTEPLPAYQLVAQQLPLSVNRIAITKVNKDGGEVIWDNAYAHILVGGEKLGRGYTVEGLTVTYMPRGPGGFTADTIQQRARFFGYRESYIDLCRVYIHPEVRGVYENYLQHEAHMRRQIARLSGGPLKDWKRAFYLDSEMKPTRHNVVSVQYFRPRLNNGWFFPLAPHIEKSTVERNRTVVKHLLSHLTFEKDSKFKRHSYAVVPLVEVYRNFLIHLVWANIEDAVRFCALNCNIADLVDPGEPAGNQPLCLIYYMDGGRGRERTAENGKIKQLFQGRSSAGKENYPGDREFYDQSMVTLQLYKLRVVTGSAEGARSSINDVFSVAVRLPAYIDTLIQH